MKMYQDSWVAEMVSQKPKLFNHSCMKSKLGVARHIKANRVFPRVDHSGNDARIVLDQQSNL